MPIYEYACDSCHSTFERKQKFTDEPVRECPECGSSVRRVLYPAGIIFKGSGFYATDSRNSSSVKTPAADSKSGASSDAPIETSAKPVTAAAD
jgi:putative FmdB family regulatory protein